MTAGASPTYAGEAPFPLLRTSGQGPIEAAEGGYRPDLDGVISTLQRYARAPFPVRFMGFPSYT